MMDLMAYIDEQLGNKTACPRVHIYKLQFHDAKAMDRCVFLGLVEDAFFFFPRREVFTLGPLGDGNILVG